MSKDYVARMFIVQVVNIKGQVVKEQRVPAFTHDHAAQIVWDKTPDDGTPSDVWEDAKRGMAKAKSGFVKVREASSVE